MTVYTPLNQPNHDLSPAEEYGEIDVMFPLGVNVINVDVIADSARKAFQDFDFQDDYFLPVGSPIVVSIVSMCLMEEAIAVQVDSFKLLEWDNRDRSYVEREITLTDWD